MSEERKLTFGETLVGVNFNPSQDEKVKRAKELCAELADILFEEVQSGGTPERFVNDLYNHAIGEILNAQMNVVKVLTLKK